ncbi:MAG TPA: AEC family transporter [Pseudolysinimonas sp.]|jgi:predicted permease|nr:AEC family transporter [Pseudolysinimonas sp.]
MGGVLIGFAIIAVVIGVGYLIGRFDLLGAGADRVMARLAFFVLTPALLFTVLAEADVRQLFSQVLPISAAVAGLNIVVYAVVARAVWRRPAPETVIGSLASGYVNGNNIGLPVSLYVLGDASSSAPVILLQLVLLAPIALMILDLTTSGEVSLRRILLQPVRNPLIIGSLLGLLVAVTGVTLPDAVLAPFELVGAAAVPVVLLGFGMSLHGSRPLAPGTERRDVVLASILKLAVMPVAAWALGFYVFGLTGHTLFVVTVLAALPTAQNVFNYAQRYGRGVVLARDAVLITTALSVVVLVIVAALLAPA